MYTKAGLFFNEYVRKLNFVQPLRETIAEIVPRKQAQLKQLVFSNLPLLDIISPNFREQNMARLSSAK
jgi:hypothetical protein